MRSKMQLWVRPCCMQRCLTMNNVAAKIVDFYSFFYEVFHISNSPAACGIENVKIRGYVHCVIHIIRKSPYRQDNTSSCP